MIYLHLSIWTFHSAAVHKSLRFQLLIATREAETSDLKHDSEI